MAGKKIRLGIKTVVQSKTKINNTKSNNNNKIGNTNVRQSEIFKLKSTNQDKMVHY